MIAAGTLFLLGALIAAGVAWDRRNPLDIITLEVAPTSQVVGDWIVVRKEVRWHRRCVGDVYSEIVGSDKVIRYFTRETIGPPFDLELPTIHHRRIKIPIDVPRGPAVYRSAIIFRNCGITSRWGWPLDILGTSVRLQVEGEGRLSQGEGGPKSPLKSVQSPLDIPERIRLSRQLL